MKIAYLILAHNNYKHLNRLIAALDINNASFYLHIDKKAKLPNIKGENISFIKNRIKIYWANFSIIRATLKLLERAIEDNNDYYVLLSGMDYPVTSNKEIENKLKSGGEFIDLEKGFSNHQPKSRFIYYYFKFERRSSGITARVVLKLEQILRKIRIKKKIPFQIYTGSAWFALTANCVKYILNEIEKNKKYVNFFRSCKFPDESFFHTIIGNSKFNAETKSSLTYVDWGVNASPLLINEKRIPFLREITAKRHLEKQCPLFARKFSNDTIDILEQIDKELRGV
jgi:hypothetical protein